MKIKIKMIIGFVFASLVFGACELDRLPETSISDPGFWKNENDLQAATNYLYTFLPGLPVTKDVWSDDAYGTSSNSISDGSRRTPSSASFYGNQYELIRAATNIMEKAPGVLELGADPDRVKWYIAEAKFFRAWAYFNLFRRYGGVPIILKTLSINDEKLYKGQGSREEVINVIYEDLSFAIANLRAPHELPAEDYGRITNTAALAFKARVALFEGTRSKFHSYGDPERHLQIAKESAKKLIDSGEHSLFSDYFNLFQYEGEGPQNKGNILVRLYGKSLEESISYHNAQRNLETGSANPTRALATSYLMEDGLPIEKSPLWEKPEAPWEIYDQRDPRMAATFFKKGDSYIGTNPVFDVPDLRFHRTGYSNRRYANIEDWSRSRSFIDHTLIRYAEVLLIYAEATFELNNEISDDDLAISINKLRARVGMPPLTNSFVATHNLDMRTEIRRERRIELALEGFRYWDLIRWKTAESVLPKPVLGSYYFDEFEAIIPQTNENNIIVVQKAEYRSFVPSKDYLWPFPVNELSLNPELEQNPGW